MGATSPSEGKAATAKHAPGAARSHYKPIDAERAMALRNKLVPMRAQLVRNLLVALDGEKLALLSAVGGAISVIDDMIEEHEAGTGRWQQTPDLDGVPNRSDQPVAG